MPELKNTLVQDLLLIRKELHNQNIDAPKARTLAHVAFLQHLSNDPYTVYGSHDLLLDILFPESQEWADERRRKLEEKRAQKDT